MLDSRTTLRYPIDLPARLAIGASELACRVRNLSLGGVFVGGPLITIGTRVRLRVAVPDLDPLDSWCISRWHADRGSGLQFEGLRPLDVHALARIIRHASRSTSRFSTQAILGPPAG